MVVQHVVFLVCEPKVTETISGWFVFVGVFSLTCFDLDTGLACSCRARMHQVMCWWE